MLTASWLALAMLALAEPPQAPFRTNLPWNLGEGQWEIISSLSFESDAHPPFFTEEPDFTRDVWHASVVDVSYGLGPRTEGRLQAGWQHVEERGGTTASGVEDVRLTVQQRLPGKRIASAVNVEVKLPNAHNEERLGTDEADVLLSGSAGWRNAAWGWAGEAGLGILGNPREAATQDDVLLFGLAGWHWVGTGGRAALVSLEASGLAASRLGNDMRRATVGVTWTGIPLPLTLDVSRGLTKVSEDWGVAVRVTLRRGSTLPSR
jgi:hypothetical protein